MTEPEFLPYPGEAATPQELLVLANQYSMAAECLLGKKSTPLASRRAPAFFCAIHAIELYLAALLRHFGESQGKVRSFQHRLSDMAEHAAVETLGLRTKTRRHLGKLTESREYLVARYAPEQMERLSEITRIQQTLSEVGQKVCRRIDGRQ